MKSRMAIWILAGALTGGAGCRLGPDFKTPAIRPDAAPMAGWQTVAAPGAGGAAQRADPALDLPAQWWALFQCPALDDWVREALTNSPTLTQAEARLRQAQEEFRAQSGQTLYPAVNAGLSASRQKVNPEAMGFSDVPAPNPFALYGVNLSVAYTFDFFGKNRRLREGLGAQVERRSFEAEAARQSLVANIVLTAIRGAENRALIDLSRAIVEVRGAQMETARERHQAGGLSTRELEEQGLRWQQARAVLPRLEQEQAKIRRQLAVYLGREPAAAPEAMPDLAQFRLPETVPASLPSEWARCRPDIRAAEALWHQACANVGVAAADLFPRFTLSASLGSQTPNTADLLTGLNVWNVGGQLMQPVFRGGELRAKKRAAVALCEESAAVYRQTVLRGLQEVADALSALAADARALEALARAADHARLAAGLAERQYADGGLSRIAWGDEKIRSYQAESERIRAQVARQADTAVLFYALGGGGWNRGKTDTRMPSPR